MVKKRAAQKLLDSVPSWSLLSAMIIIGGDLAIGTPEVLASIFPPAVLIVFGTLSVAMGVMVAIAVFLIEYMAKKDFTKAITYGLIGGFLVWIPYPIAGTLVAAIAALDSLKVLNKHDLMKHL